MDSVFEVTYQEIINNKVPTKLKNLIAVLIESNDSYSPNWHALGFVHCKLATFSYGTLRLHIWPPQERHSQEQQHKIHDHIFSLTSYVLSGSINNEIYSIQGAQKNVASTQCYNVNYIKGGAKIRATEQYYNETQLSKSLVEEGEHYNVLSGVLHQSTVPESTFVVTIVATYDHKVSAPRLLGSINGPESFIREQISYDKKKWIKLLRNIENNL